ncbi:hypothetical protein vBAmePPT11V19_00063 [Alteromonas phage vB_AmeP_PT11-V19]|nr:hypothetical protein vBAmePPT11V19_00063 [Alteromonas phage vB_AmeP_PT11-V19]
MPIKNVKVYQPPKGMVDVIDITEVDEETSNFFNNNGYQVSVEQLNTGKVAVYAMPPSGKDEDEITLVDFKEEGPMVIFPLLAAMCKKAQQNEEQQTNQS